MHCKLINVDAYLINRYNWV